MSSGCVNCGRRVVDPLRLFKKDDPECTCPYCGELYNVLSQAPPNPLAFFVENRRQKK